MEIKYELKDFNKNHILKAYGVQKANYIIGDSAELFLSNNCFRRMHKYVPLDTGLLASHATVRPGSVTYEENYAHKQYTTNKGKGIRGKYWDKKMIANERDALTREVERFMKKKKGNS